MQKVMAVHAGVIQADVRPSSGSVILVFNPEKADVTGLLTAVLIQVANPRAFPDTCDVENENENTACTRCRCEMDTPATFSSKARRVGWLSGVMVYALIRKWVFGLALAQTPLSFLGLAAISGTIPLIKEAVKDTAEKRKVTVKPFLSAGSIATIMMGEAFSAIQILWIYNVAELTEDYVAQRSRKAIRNILEVAPANAYVMRDGMEVETPVADIRPDDVVAAHTGEKIPVDGIILDGDALVDEATINGRSEAVFKEIGDKVYAGTIISQGTLFIRTMKTGQDTYLAGIMRLVEGLFGQPGPGGTESGRACRTTFENRPGRHPGHPGLYTGSVAGTHRDAGHVLSLRHGSGRIIRHHRIPGQCGPSLHFDQGRVLSGAGGTDRCLLF